MQDEGLKLVSRQFRNSNVWHSGLPSLLWCFGPAGGVLASQLQEDAGKLGGGSAGRQANGRFEASF